MCAICGIIRFDGRPVERADLEALRDVMVNRGPEHGGAWFGAGAALGHRRLRIIDLSPLGNQPMANEDETVQVTFNGEIYNFPELREQLLAKGHRFRSHSDTEVIAHGYEEWGEGVVAKLDGMFAFGIWDTRKRQLLLAVDRYGKKPMFLWRDGAALHFASDGKAFRALPGFTPRVNPRAVECFLHFLGTTTKHSIYEGVEKLRPAHYRVITAGATREVRYWQPDFTRKQKFTEGDALDAIEGKLTAAVKKRLLSDVPLGAFLSGGVDSSLVVALMSKLSSGPVKTFSIGFKEQDYSELEYSDVVARRYGTDHRQILLEPNVLEVLPSLVWEYGEPFADSSALPTYFVSRAAKEFVTVALTGDGGDEQFAGYDIFRASYYARMMRRSLPRGVVNALENWALKEPAPAGGLRKKLKSVLTHASADPARRHGYWMGFTPAERAELYTDDFRATLGDYQAWQVYAEYYPAVQQLDLIDQNLFLTQMGRLPDDYLVKVDVASMKVALELRSPFLDTQLGELAASIESSLKVRGGKQKYLLKKLSERYLPRDVIYRPKRGFSLPLKHWLRTDFAPLLRRLLPAGNLVRENWLRGDVIQRYLSDHTSGRADHTHRLWALLWLELWHRIFLERSLKPTDALTG